MEDLVLSIEQCRHLQELGLDMSDAKIFHIYEDVAREIDGEYCEVRVWDIRVDNAYNIKQQPNIVEHFPTYTLQEVLGKLPKRIKANGDKYFLNILLSPKIVGISYQQTDDICKYLILKTGYILDTSYKMLCWVIENGYLKTK